MLESKESGDPHANVALQVAISSCQAGLRSTLDKWMDQQESALNRLFTQHSQFHSMVLAKLGCHESGRSEIDVPQEVKGPDYSSTCDLPPLALVGTNGVNCGSEVMWQQAFIENEEKNKNLQAQIDALLQERDEWKSARPSQVGAVGVDFAGNIAKNRPLALRPAQMSPLKTKSRSSGTEGVRSQELEPVQREPSNGGKGKVVNTLKRRFSEDVNIQIEGARCKANSMGLGDTDTRVSKRKRCVRTLGGAADYIVSLHSFAIFMNATIMVQAFVIGLETDHEEEIGRDIFRVLGVLFALIFLIELVLRIIAFGKTFITSSEERTWNLFDTAVVLVSLYEVYEALSASEQQNSLGMLRMLRVVRIAKVMRIIRLVNSCKALRILVLSIFSTLKSLVWALLIMTVFVYLFGVVFTQAAKEAQSNDDLSTRTKKDLKEHFGSTLKAMLSLFKAISGGIDWTLIAEPLGDISWVYTLLFLVYVAFMVFAVMNVITGYFCHNAEDSAKQDEEHVIQEYLEERSRVTTHLKSIFLDLDCIGEEDSALTLVDFEKSMDDERIKAFFASLEIKISDAWSIFRLLDADGSQDVDLDEFVAGCLRLRGNAKSVDLANVMYRIDWLCNRFIDYVEYTETEFNGIRPPVSYQMRTSSRSKKVVSPSSSLPVALYSSSSLPRSRGQSVNSMANSTRTPNKEEIGRGDPLKVQHVICPGVWHGRLAL